MHNNIENSSQLTNLFNIEECKNYFDPVEFKEPYIGFSIKRYYPKNINYKSPVNKDGKEDVVALIRVSYISIKKIDEHYNYRVPIFVDIGSWSQYNGNRYFPKYDFEHPDCPTSQSIEISKKVKPPISLDFSNYFFYNKELNFLENNKGKKINGKELLDKVFNKHCDTVHPLKGIRIRHKIQYEKVLLKINERIIDFLTYFLEKAFGRKLFSNNFSTILNGYLQEDLKKSDVDSINIYGYKASKNVILTFCILCVLLYIISMKFGFLKNIIFNNEVLFIQWMILIFAFVDLIAPWIIFLLINRFIKDRMYFFKMNV